MNAQLHDGPLWDRACMLHIGSELRVSDYLLVKEVAHHPRLRGPRNHLCWFGVVLKIPDFLWITCADADVAKYPDSSDGKVQ